MARKTENSQKIEEIIESLSNVEIKTLNALKKTGKKQASFDDIIAKTKLNKITQMRAFQWLENKGIAEILEEKSDMVTLDKNGIIYKEKGLPEMRLLNALKDGQLSKDAAVKKAGLNKDEETIAIGILRKRGLINIKKDKGLVLEITETGANALGKQSLEEKFLKIKFPVGFDSLNEQELFAFNELKKRKQIIKVDSIKQLSLKLTDLGIKLLQHNLDEQELIEALSPEILKNGQWKGKRFKRYDVSINVPKIFGGKRHFVNQAIRHIKRIWLDLGFKEMTGTMIQTAFWDLDALFVPQDHPAREMQDTFYIKDPAKGKLPEIKDIIKQVHENGWKTGSKGWQYKWNEEKAKENLLRTHTTVLSARTIANIKETEMPAKFFTVNKVYRNETLSWKHLFELNQVEGIVVDVNANMKHLKGYLKDFFAKMGFEDVRIRPAHFPYTEPSAEIDVLVPEKNQWVELGGSGIFRPEVTRPLIGKEVPVLAWGFGMERTIMAYYGIKDIRDLYKNDLGKIRKMKIWV